MSIKLISVFTLLFLNFAIAEEIALFEFEPTIKATAVSGDYLQVGDILDISVKGIKDNELLILQRCGEPCKTAKLIEQWNNQSFKNNKKCSIKLVEDGIYYFWIRQLTDSGEVGPVMGVDQEVNSSSAKLTFESGTIVKISLRQ